MQCGGCTNHCQLTVNAFPGGRRLISGNRCEKPVPGKGGDGGLNLYRFKQELMARYKPAPAKRGTIGIPLCLNMYELLPFWHAFFTSLGFAVVTSPLSTPELCTAGQASIPSDTVCFPAKLAHGHIWALAELRVDAIFYPCMSYNLDERLGDNHYNCPVVAYYPEVLEVNCPELARLPLFSDFVGLHRPGDFKKKMPDILAKYFRGISKQEVAPRPTLPMPSTRPTCSACGTRAPSSLKRPGRRADGSLCWRAGPTMWTRRSITAATS